MEAKTLIDNVATGPVTLRPGERRVIDGRAWNALAMLAGRRALSAYMLMHYEPGGRFGRLCAAFKHRDTRIYRRVSYCYSLPARANREPQFEPMRDYLAQRAFTLEIERCGIVSTGCREVLRELRERAERLTGRLIPDQTPIYGVSPL